MIPAAGLLGLLKGGGIALGAGLEFPLHGILGEAIKSTYKDAAVPDDAPGYVVRGRALHKDNNPGLNFRENVEAYFTPSLHHYQFFDNNGKNFGFAPWGVFSEDAKFFPEYMLGTPFGNVRYDKNVVDKGMEERQKAIDKIRTMKMENPDLYGELDDADLGDYEALMNNCHDFITDVLWRGTGRSGR